MCKIWRSFDDHGGELLQMMRMLMRDAKRFVQLEICLVRCKTRSDSQKKDKTHFPATKRPPSYSKSRQWVWLSCKKWVVGMVELQEVGSGYGWVAKKQAVGMVELQLWVWYCGYDWIAMQKSAKRNWPGLQTASHYKNCDFCEGLISPLCSTQYGQEWHAALVT